MQKWEYKLTESSLSEDQINELGYEGWELVAVLAHEYHGSSTSLIFKRPLD